MTISPIVPDPWNYEHPDDNYCPFDLVPSSNGRWLLWWPEENTWVASFPSLEVAHRVVIGTEDWHSQPGWDQSTFPLDLRVALKRIQHNTGKLPQFELSETSNIFDLYVPLGLGFEAFARLSHWEVETTVGVDQKMVENYCPLVAQCLSGSRWDLTTEMVAHMTPIVTELLLRQTKAQNRMKDEMRASRPTVRKLKASKVRKMCKGRLLRIAGEYELDIDIDKFSNTKRKADAVIASLAALGLLK
jgi:hypothetical protein